MTLQLNGSIVDMMGDGVWPEMSKLIRDDLIAAFINVDWKIHDINLYQRDKTDDTALDNALKDLKEHRAGVKGPTITPTEDQTAAMGLSKQWGSPNGKLRRVINGAVIMRTPLDVKTLPKNAPDMADVTVARQAVGGIYGAPNFDVPADGKLEITFTDADGKSQILAAKDVSRGVAMLTTESDESITNFAHAVFQQGLSMNKSIVFASKSTINPTYDGRFIDIMSDIYTSDYKSKFDAKGLEFRANNLIDAIVSQIPQGKLNGCIVAFKNYDGDVGSDQVAGEHISLGMMDSTLVSADGILLADPPHGTAPDLDKFWHEEQKLVANPTAYIFAYAEAIRHKAELNGQDDVAAFALKLKEQTLKTIENGHMTGDLSRYLDGVEAITAQEFVAEIKALLQHDCAKTNAA